MFSHHSPLHSGCAKHRIIQSFTLYPEDFSVCHQSRALTWFSRGFLTAWLLLISLRTVFNASPWRRVHTQPRTVHRRESFICFFPPSSLPQWVVCRTISVFFPLLLLSVGGFDPLRRPFKGIFHTEVGSCGWKSFLKAC